MTGPNNVFSFPLLLFMKITDQIDLIEAFWFELLHSEFRNPHSGDRPDKPDKLFTFYLSPK